MMSGNHMMTGTPSVVFLIPFATRQARTNWSTACSIYSRPSVPYETRPIKITKSLLPHSCLVPGPPRCCSTTLIQRFAAQFSYLGYELTLFLSMASSIEPVPTAWLASLAIALTSSVCGCAWELFGGQDSSRKSSGKNSCLVDWKIEIRAMLRQ